MENENEESNAIYSKLWISDFDNVLFAYRLQVQRRRKERKRMLRKLIVDWEWHIMN